MNNENLTLLAKQNLESFHNESELADYLAFLFSELSRLDSGWKKTLESDLSELGA